MRIGKLVMTAFIVAVAQQSYGQATAASNLLTGVAPNPNEFLGSSNGYNVLFKANNVERMRILSSNGFVGIGTIAPVTSLNIATTSTNDGIRIHQNGGTASAVGLFNSTGRNYALFSTGSGNGEGAGHFGIFDYSGGGYRLLIQSNTGNVALGGTTPQARLHVTGNAVITSTTGAPVSAAYIRGNNGNSGATTPDYTWWNNDQTGLFHPAANVIGFTNGGAESMRITSNGSVGVGTNNPLGKLHVENGLIRVTGPNPSGGPMVVFGGNASTAVNGEWGIEYDASTAGFEGLNFWRPFGCTGTSGNYFLFAHNSGRIGVNTNNPTAQLTVNGNVLIGDPAVVCIPNANYKLFVQTGILTEKVKVAINCTANWSDYVFESDYKLTDLKSLEAYVKENKHLPNIPSAEEVVKDGVELGEMTSKLLGKVEELTLYLIEQNKQMELLQKEVESLKNH